MNSVVIIGVGGHGREMLALIQSSNSKKGAIEVIGWLDDRLHALPKKFKGLPVLGLSDDLSKIETGTRFVVGIGSSPARLGIVSRLEEATVEFVTLIHPTAWVGPDVLIGSGSQIAASATLSTDIRVHRHVIVNQGATIAHDVEVNDFATIAPGAHVSGGVTVGEGAEIGSGAVIKQGVHVGAWSIVGAGAVVISNVPANSTVVGVPSHVIDQREDGWHER